MKSNRYIAWFLCAVYLAVTAYPAAASLTCKCLTTHAAVEHACGGCCAHAGAHIRAEAAECPADGALSAPCCTDRHSTDIALYTASPDGERPCKCAVLMLPHCLLAARAAQLASPKFRKEHPEPPAVLPQAPCLHAAGLRAPPVSV